MPSMCCLVFSQRFVDVNCFGATAVGKCLVLHDGFVLCLSVGCCFAWYCGYQTNVWKSVEVLDAPAHSDSIAYKIMMMLLLRVVFACVFFCGCFVVSCSLSNLLLSQDFGHGVAFACVCWLVHQIVRCDSK